MTITVAVVCMLKGARLATLLSVGSLVGSLKGVHWYGLKTFCVTTGGHWENDERPQSPHQSAHQKSAYRHQTRVRAFLLV